MEPRSVPGLVITLLGIALVAQGMFGNNGPNDLFLPIMLIFIGRAISRRAKRGQPVEKKPAPVAGGTPTGNVETLQEEFRAEQSGSGRQRAHKSLEDRLREALMVPPMTTPAPPRPRVTTQQPTAEQVVHQPSAEEPVFKADPEPRIETVPRIEERPRVEASTPAPHPAIGTPPFAPSVRPSYQRTGGMTRRSAAPSTASRIHTKSSSELVAEAKERLKALRSQSPSAADRRA